jgi:hypothetical protein
MQSIKHRSSFPRNKDQSAAELQGNRHPVEQSSGELHLSELQMLRRPPTRIPLKTEDIEEYEEVSAGSTRMLFLRYSIHQV